MKSFVREVGLGHVRTAPHYPQSNAKKERFYQALKGECLRPQTPLSLDDARRAVGRFVAYYNHASAFGRGGNQFLQVSAVFSGEALCFPILPPDEPDPVLTPPPPAVPPDEVGIRIFLPRGWWALSVAGPSDHGGKVHLPFSSFRISLRLQITRPDHSLPRTPVHSSGKPQFRARSSERTRPMAPSRTK